MSTPTVEADVSGAVAVLEHLRGELAQHVPAGGGDGALGYVDAQLDAALAKLDGRVPEPRLVAGRLGPRT